MRSIWFVAALLTAACSSAGAQDINARIAAEVARLQQSLKDSPIGDPDIKDVASNAEAMMKASSEALQTGRVYLSLEKLEQAFEILEGARSAADKSGVVKGGLPAFETVWGNESVKLAAVERVFGAKNWKTSQQAIRALSESARGKAVPLLDGARGFATSTKPQDGLFYIGQARGAGEFAQFCASLNLPHTNRPRPERSLLAELRALQNKANIAFVPPRSIEMHPRFIALNSTIKAASELDARRFYAGALYQYLEAVRHYAMLDTVAPDAARQTALKDEIAALHRKLASSPYDDSIALLFLERAASQIAHSDGSTPSADELRSALAIVGQVMPAYDAALKPPPHFERAKGKTIDLTLVRWPYT